VERFDAIARDLSARCLLPLVLSVCERRGVLLHEVCGRGRSQAVKAARHEVWYLLRNDTRWLFSFSELGRIFHRDHTTIRAGVLAHARAATTQP
jgi:chromosomal replication initiation ATPase DnaA